MKAPLIKMLSVSLAVIILLWVASAAIFSKKTGLPKPGFDYRKMEAMSFSEAKEYSKQNIETMSGLRAEMAIWRIPGEPLRILEYRLLHFVSVFLGCYVFWRWSSKISSNSVQLPAGRSAASGG